MDERARVTRARRRRTRRRGGSPPLPRRRTDRIEDVVAWLLTSLGLFALLGSALVGHAAHQAALGRAAAAIPVRAELLADAPRPAEAPQRVPLPRPHAPATWTDAHGVRHVGTVAVPPARTAGSTVTLWVDPAGRIVADPAERSAEASAFGISAGLTVVAVSWALVTLVWAVVCRATAACNAAGWAREWARVEPRWRRSPS